MTIQLTFTPEDRESLNELRYSHPSPIVQRRAETLWLKSLASTLNLKHEAIAQIAGVSENTQRDYFALYRGRLANGLCLQPPLASRNVHPLQ